MAVFPELTTDGDWVLGAFADGDRAILLDVLTACQEWLRDCWFAQGAGIDWNIVLGGGDTTPFLVQQLTQVISNREGVTAITNLTPTITGDKVVVSVSFTTIYGTELSTAVNGQ